MDLAGDCEPDLLPDLLRDLPLAEPEDPDLDRDLLLSEPESVCLSSERNFSILLRTIVLVFGLKLIKFNSDLLRCIDIKTRVKYL